MRAEYAGIFFGSRGKTRDFSLANLREGESGDWRALPADGAMFRFAKREYSASGLRWHTSPRKREVEDFLPRIIANVREGGVETG